MVRNNIAKYLSIPHSYDGINCLTLIHEFYKNELNIDCIAELIPENIEEAGRRWMSKITLPEIEEWALIHGTKVNLTNAQDFDVIVFKSVRFESLRISVIILADISVVIGPNGSIIIALILALTID